MTKTDPKARPSPASWSYDFNPYRHDDGREIPAFEIFDAEQNRIFTTEESGEKEVQETNARLASTAPCLRDALRECVRVLADFDDFVGEEGDVYREGLTVLKRCE